MKVLEMKHIKKTFDELEVLKDISFDVSEGEVVSIIGPSGSGKSTILRCATMLEEIDGGEFSYLGKKAAWQESGTSGNGKTVYAPKSELRETDVYKRQLPFFLLSTSSVQNIITQKG